MLADIADEVKERSPLKYSIKSLSEEDEEAAHHFVILDVVARASLSTVWTGVREAKAQPKVFLAAQSLVTSPTHHQPS